MSLVIPLDHTATPLDAVMVDNLEELGYDRWQPARLL
jgi:hypothetical protein